MLKSIRHNPRIKMAKADIERLDAMETDLLKMTPEHAEKWVESNVKTLPELKAVVVELVKAVNALSYVVRQQK